MNNEHEGSDEMKQRLDGNSFCELGGGDVPWWLVVSVFAAMILLVAADALS